MRGEGTIPGIGGPDRPGAGDDGDFEGMLDRIGRFISEGISEGRFTESQAHHDLDIALWVAVACEGIGDYEHHVTAAQWLADVEDLAGGSADWHHLYARALVFCGRPGRAMEYLLRGLDNDPHHPGCLLELGRLRAHLGDREGALEAARAGPTDDSFRLLIQQIGDGVSLEEMELDGRTDDESREAVLGIVTDDVALARTKESLSPVGWIADHPYCTFMHERPEGPVLVTLAMNEAYLSKLPSEAVAGIIDRLPHLEAQARDSLGQRAEGRPLCAVTVDRRLRPMLSFGGVGGQDPLTVEFDEDLRPTGVPAKGGPFIAMVLLKEQGWDPELIKRELGSRWGIRTSHVAEGDSLVFECGGDLAVYSITRTPVPDGEAEGNASNNYAWPEGPAMVAGHRAHLLVALVNHRSDAVESAVLHTKLVSAACSQPGALGVYFPGTVVPADEYSAEADAILDGRLPIRDWVWIGMYVTSGGFEAYTRGMSVFGLSEIESVGSTDQPDRLRAFMEDVVYHVLTTGCELPDGGEVRHPDGRTLRCELSPGIALDEDTIKLVFPQDEGARRHGTIDC